MNLDKDFVTEEPISESTMMPLQASDIFRVKLIAPKSDRLVTDDNTALRQQIFNIPILAM